MDISQHLIRVTRSLGLGSDRKLVRASIGSLGLKVFATGVAFITSIVLARLLGATEYGAYSYAMAWAQLLIVPSMLGMEKVAIRETSVYTSSSEWGGFRGFALWSTRRVLAASSVVAAGLVLFVLSIKSLIDPVYVFPLCIGSLLIPFTAVTRLRQSIMIGMSQVVLGQAPEAIVTRVFFLALVIVSWLMVPGHLHGGSAVALNIIAVFIGMLFGLWLLRRLAWKTLRSVEPLTVDNHRWRQAIIPMTVLALLQMLNARVDVLLLGILEPPASVGLYNVAFRIGTLISFFPLAANAAIAATVASAYSENNSARLQAVVAKSAMAVFLISTPFAVVFVVFGSEILSIFGEEFKHGALALALIAVGQLINSAFGPAGLCLTMTGHERMAAKGAFGSVIVATISSYFLIDHFGIVGAAIAFTLATLIWNLFCTVAVYQKIGVIASIFGYFARRNQ